MKVMVTSTLSRGDLRLDAKFHTSEGKLYYEHLSEANVSGLCSIEKLIDVCEPNGVFIPGRFKRIFVESSTKGYPYISGSSILETNPLEGAKFLSKRLTNNIEKLLFLERMILITCSGNIGNTTYVNSFLSNALGSPDLIRVIANEAKINSGYLFCFLSSDAGSAFIRQKTYGAVIPHIEAHHIFELPIPRFKNKKIEADIDILIKEAYQLRAYSNYELETSKKRFYNEVLSINPEDAHWECTNFHAFSYNYKELDQRNYRLDAFHYVGYVEEAEKYITDKAFIGDLVDAYQPPMFKRPYTGSNGIPFLSGIDLYNYYPKPHMYISKKTENLDLYRVKAGTILVQRVGQRYGLFGRPTILPKHLDNAAVTEHLYRLYPKDPRDRGFVYVWLSTEVGRRLLLKNSFGTSMGVLDDRSFRDTPIPLCSNELRHSFEDDVQRVCEMRERANELEDQAQELLYTALGLGGDHV